MDTTEKRNRISEELQYVISNSTDKRRHFAVFEKRDGIYVLFRVGALTVDEVIALDRFLGGLDLAVDWQADAVTHYSRVDLRTITRPQREHDTHIGARTWDRGTAGDHSDVWWKNHPQGHQRGRPRKE